MPASTRVTGLMRRGWAAKQAEHHIKHGIFWTAALITARAITRPA